MAASITIAHGQANTNLPVRIPHLMPFHIQHTGPAPISTYFRIRPHDSHLLPSTAPTAPETSTSPSSRDGQPLTTTAAAAEPNTEVPLCESASAAPVVVDKEAEKVASPRTGTIARLSEFAKRFISSFRGRAVQGVEVALPEGYVGVVLRGDANHGKVHQTMAGSSSKGKTKARPSSRRGQLRRKPQRGSEEEEEEEGCLDEAVGEMLLNGDERPVRVLKPAARFDSFVLWHPDIPVDEGRDEYLRSLSEWVNIAAEIHQNESLPT